MSQSIGGFGLLHLLLCVSVFPFERALHFLLRDLLQLLPHVRTVELVVLAGVEAAIIDLAVLSVLHVLIYHRVVTLSTYLSASSSQSTSFKKATIIVEMR